MISPQLEGWIRKEATPKIELHVLKNNNHPIPYCIKYNGEMLKVGGKTSWRTAGWAKAAIRSHMLYSMFYKAFEWVGNNRRFIPTGEILSGGDEEGLKEAVLDYICTKIVSIEKVS